MDNTSGHMHTPGGVPTPSAPKRKLKWLKWTAIVLGCVIAVPMLLLVAMSVFLTSDRLTELVNREASEYLNADIHASEVDYTLWTTFPRLKITTGRLTVKSRTLNGVAPEIKHQLPDSADFLGEVNSFSGEINVVDLFMNRYVIHDVKIDGLKVNLVAFNDSVNNYDILPSAGEKLKKVPYIRVNHITVKNAGTLSYYSASTNTKAKIMLEDLNLERDRRHGIPSDTYTLQVGGKVTAESSGLRILHNFPISLDGKMHLKFSPFRVQLSDFGIDLGVIHSKLSMSVGVGDNPGIESFDYKISNVSLASLMGYIPSEFIPPVQGIKADLQVSATAKLLSAWSFSSETFPSISVKFEVPSGMITYTTLMPEIMGQKSHSEDIALNHSPIVCDFVFNGEKPQESYIRVPQFRVAGEGMILNLSAFVTRLTEHPHVDVDLGLQADVARTIQSIDLLPEVNARGKVSLNSVIGFDLASLTKEGISGGLSNLTTSGTIEVPSLAFDIPQWKMKGNLSGLQIDVDEYSASVSSESIVNPSIALTAKIGEGEVKVADMSGKLNGFVLTAASSYKGRKSPSQLSEGIPVEVQGGFKHVEYFSPSDNLHVMAEDVSLSDELQSRQSRSFSQLLSDGLNMQIKRCLVGFSRNTLDFNDITLAVALSERDSSEMIERPSLRIDKITPEDVSEEIAELPHTPTLIKVNTPEGLRNFLNRYSLTASAKVGRINLLTEGLHADNYLANVDLKINDDYVEIANLYADVENTRGTIRAKIGNLRSFLLNPASERNPLTGELDVAVDTININALAHAYVVSRGGMKNIPRHDTVTADDSTALLLPRNLALDVNLTAKETDYTNLQFYNLNADIGLRNGILDIPNLALSTDFGKAALNVKYYGNDIERMSLNLGVDIEDIDIVLFFRKFHSLLRMMPEMKNLSGFISADINLNADIFPDMYLNIPSADVAADVEGRELTLHQSHFIRKITKMMMITSDDDIHIKNMDVHVSAHDNLLQLDPFYFEFDKYKIQMLGVNNFDGNLYYHIGVEKSPIPFPFGINIEGEFHHPKLRFGGEHFNQKRAEEITSQIQENNKMNMTKVLKQLLRAFIGKAAESDEATHSLAETEE